MGGKTGTTTQQVQIPKEVLDRYTSVNKTAESVAQTPFQRYGGEFVAPLNEIQNQGIGQTQQYAQSAQPYYGQAQGLTMGGAGAVGTLTPQDIAKYENPYVQSVVNPTLQALQQQQGYQMSSLVNPQTLGAFGGDRSGLVANNLARQQELATAQAISPLYQDAYKQAVQTATQQQGVEAQNLARELQAGAQMGQLGSGAQAAALQGAQAVTGAGTLGQQTQQALDTAQYQQFLQERGYPFQVAQFLAGIAEGTGALSGSTTTTTAPSPIMSDARLKDNIEEVGQLHDGQKVYRYDMGDGRTQIGLLAQEVTHHKPEAVGLHPSGFMMVDYRGATDDAADRGRGLVPSSMGGAVFEPGHYADGGGIDFGTILAMQRQFQGGGQGGQGGGGPYGGRSYVPQSQSSSRGLATPGAAPRPGESGLGQGLEAGTKLAGLYKVGKEIGQDTGLIGKDSSAAAKSIDDSIKDVTGKSVEWAQDYSLRSRGGSIHRHGYATAGSVNPYGLSADPIQEAVDEGKNQQNKLMAPGAPPPQSPGIGGQALQAGMAAKGIYDVGKMAMGAPEAISSAASTLGPMASTIGSGIGSAATGVASGVGAAASGIGSLMSELGPLMLLALKDGGTVDRKAYATRGGTDPNGSDQEQPNYEALLTQAANKYGLNPQDLIRVGRAESGLVPKPGDDNSSGGVLQFHFAGASPKYPNPGLGDEYLASRNPDLASKGTPAQKLAYLNDAKNQADMADYAAHHISKNGYGAWTTARNMGLADKPVSQNYAAQSRGLPSSDDLANRFMAPATTTGKTEPAEDRGGVKGLLGSEKFWIPLLAGLGDMASSNSRYLGSAILQGLGGGAKAYAGLEQQQGERALKQQQIDVDRTRVGVDALKDFMSRYTPVNDQAGNIIGYTNEGRQLTVPQFQSELNAFRSSILGGTALDVRRAISEPALQGRPVDTKNLGAGTPGTDTPAIGQPAQPGQPPLDNLSSVINAIDKSNPDSISKGVAALRELQAKTSGNPATTRISDQARERADYWERFLADPEKAKQESLSKLGVEDFGRFRNEATSRSENFPRNDQAISDLARVYEFSRSGRAAEFKQGLYSWAAGLLGSESSVLDGLKRAIYSQNEDPSGFDTAMKLATKTVIDELASAKLTRAPAASINALRQIVASPTLEPGAVFEILANAKAELEFSKKRDEYVMENIKDGESPYKYMTKFDRENKDILKKEKANALMGIPDPMDVSPQKKEQLYKEYGRYGYNPVEKEKLRTERPSGSAAPAATPAPSRPVPPIISDKPGLAWSETRQQFRDANGIIYDKNGNALNMSPERGG